MLNQQPSILSRTTTLFGRGVIAYCVVAAVAGAFGTVFTLAVISAIKVQSPGPYDPITIWRSITALQKLFLVFGVMLAIWLPTLLGARGICRITFDLLAGQTPSLGKILVNMARFLPAAIVYSVCVGMPTMISSSCLYVPGVLVAALFTLVIPTGIDEGGNIYPTLKRGVSLSQSVYGKVLLTTAVSVVLVGMALAIRLLLLDRLIAGLPIPLVAVRITLIAIPSLLMLILANICFTLLYLEARQKDQVASPPASAAASG